MLACTDMWGLRKAAHREKHDKLFTGKTARNYKKSTWWAPVFCHFKNYMDIDMREFM